MEGINGLISVSFKIGDEREREKERERCFGKLDND